VQEKSIDLTIPMFAVNLPLNEKDDEMEDSYREEENRGPVEVA